MTMYESRSGVRVLLAALGLLLFAAPLGAQDQLVLQALRRIEKYEALEPSLKAGDQQTAQRYLGALRFAKKRLDGAYNKKTTHWTDAARRYNALIQKINARAKGQPAPAPSSKPATGPSGAGQPAAGKGSAGVPAAGSPAAGSPATKAVDQRQLQVLNSKIQRAFHNMKSCRIAEFARESLVQSYREQIVGFRTQVAGLPPADANVAIVTKNIDAMQNLLDAALKEVEKNRAPEGAAEKIAAMTKFYANFGALKPLEAPLDPARVQSWAEQMRAFRDERMPADLRWVDSVRGKIGIQLQPWQRLRGLIASSWPLKLRGLMERNMASIEAPARTGKMFVETMLKVDPKNQTQVRNMLLREGAMARKTEQLAEAENAFRVAAAYAKGLQTKGGTDWSAWVPKVERARDHLRRCAETGLADVRLPKAASTDAKLLANAREVLKRKKYGAGEPIRLLINAKLQRKEKHEGSITPGTVSATVTMYHYVWDQYQVTTVEREGDKLWIYFNWLRFYHKGGSTTPTGRWIVSNRFRGSPILEENLDK